MSELPNREIKRDEFMKRLEGRLEPGFSEDDRAFLYQDSLTRQCLALEIVKERMFQIAKWGTNPVPIFVGLAILLEEVGEASKAVLENNPKEYRSELVQVAAVCMRLIEELDSFNLKDDSFSGTREAPPVALGLTERQKSELILDEWSKSDDPVLCQSAANIRASISAIDAFNKGHYDESTPAKPTGYLNGKIEAIEKRLEACELYEKKVENIEASLSIYSMQAIETAESLAKRLGAFKCFMLEVRESLNRLFSDARVNGLSSLPPKRPGGVIVDEMLDARCRQANQELLDHFTTCIKAPSMRTHAKVTLSLSKSGTWSARFTVKETLYYETGGYISLDALIANAKRQLDGCDFNLTDEVKP